MSIINHGLIKEDISPEDHILGAETPTQPIFSKIMPPSGGVIDWVNDEPEFEDQRVGGTDTMACVSFSADNCIEYICNHKMKEDAEFKKFLNDNGLIKNDKANFSDRRTAKGSGTTREGNTVRSVGDYLRNNYFCPEDLWPMIPSGWDEYYKVMPREIEQYGSKVKPYFELFYKYLPTDPKNSMYLSSRDQIWDGLQYSPVWASVDGRYQFDEDGYVKGGWNEEGKVGTDGFQDWTHRITIRGGVYGKYWIIHDHYTNQIRKFNWNYPFGGCVIWNIQKKKIYPLVKVSGSPAIYVYKATTDEYYGIAGGEIPGGDLLKTMSGNYKNSNYITVESIPTDRIVGEIVAKKFN